MQKNQIVSKVHHQKHPKRHQTTKYSQKHTTQSSLPLSTSSSQMILPNEPTPHNKNNR